MGVKHLFLLYKLLVVFCASRINMALQRLLFGQEQRDFIEAGVASVERLIVQIVILLDVIERLALC